MGVVGAEVSLINLFPAHAVSRNNHPTTDVLARHHFNKCLRLSLAQHLCWPSSLEVLKS